MYCDICLFDDEEYRLTMWAFYLPERVWVQGQICLALTTIKNIKLYNVVGRYEENV